MTSESNELREPKTPAESNIPTIPAFSASAPESPQRLRRSASFSSTSTSSIPATFAPRQPLIKETSQAGWTFRSIRSSISSAIQIDEISHKIGFPLPTMFFGSNRIEISGPKGVSLHFDPIEAVSSVSNTSETVPVRIAAGHADFWRKKSQEEQIFDYDWTFTPQAYNGTLEGHQDITIVPDLTINYTRLKQQDPIIFFDEIILFEDELGDNGTSIVSVKLRVMAFGFFVLMTHFLRVDGVIFKKRAVRYYHEFGQSFILREVRECEESFDFVLARLSASNANYRDNDAVIQILPKNSVITEKIEL